jgi:hypothetical protein
VSTKEIRTHHQTSVCDVCGRTLLRGERADTYLDGADRRTVCELCKTRALHEGWVREGSLPAYEAGPATTQRRASLLGRLLGRGERSPRQERERSDAERDTGTDAEYEPEEWERGGASGWERDAGDQQREPADWEQRQQRDGGIVLRPLPDRASAGQPSSGPDDRPRRARRPRRLHAVPTADARRLEVATELFNRSEHCRTIAGVGRSLGDPAVCVLTVAGHAGLVRILVAWELCWYRYEVDLSEEEGEVRLCARGYELSQLDASERAFNAHADERGRLHLDTVQQDRQRP